VPDRDELFGLGFASVFSLAGHLCVIYSLRSGEVAAVAPFRYAGIVWAILIGLLIWNQLPDAVSLAGISILVSAGLYTLYREQKLRRQRTIQSTTAAPQPEITARGPARR
jgi:drug/metabolite transporter (DMT)-like permease